MFPGRPLAPRHPAHIRDHLLFAVRGAGLRLSTAVVVRGSPSALAVTAARPVDLSALSTRLARRGGTCRGAAPASASARGPQATAAAPQPDEELDLECDVAVVGGGPAGLATAAALLRVLPPGTRLKVFEARPSLASLGAGVVLHVNGLRALEAIHPGVVHRLYRVGAFCAANRLYDDTAAGGTAPFMTAPLDHSTYLREAGHTPCLVYWNDLRTALYDSLPPGTVMLGAKLLSAEELPEALPPQDWAEEPRGSGEGERVAAEGGHRFLLTLQCIRTGSDGEGGGGGSGRGEGGDDMRAEAEREAAAVMAAAAAAGGSNASGHGREGASCSRLRVRARMVVGADGFFSRVRRELVGRADPPFTGMVCWRGSFTTQQLASSGPSNPASAFTSTLASELHNNSSGSSGDGSGDEDNCRPSSGSSTPSVSWPAVMATPEGRVCQHMWVPTAPGGGGLRGSPTVGRVAVVFMAGEGAGAGTGAAGEKEGIEGTAGGSAAALGRAEGNHDGEQDGGGGASGRYGVWYLQAPLAALQQVGEDYPTAPSTSLQPSQVRNNSASGSGSNTGASGSNDISSGPHGRGGRKGAGPGAGPAGSEALRRALAVSGHLPADVRAMLAATDPARVSEHGLYEHALEDMQPGAWYLRRGDGGGVQTSADGGGGVVLVGDAAHASRPDGQGANMALEGAAALAAAVRRHGLGQKAFAEYESRQQPRARTIYSDTTPPFHTRLPAILAADLEPLWSSQQLEKEAPAVEVAEERNCGDGDGVQGGGSGGGGGIWVPGEVAAEAVAAEEAGGEGPGRAVVLAWSRRVVWETVTRRAAAAVELGAKLAGTAARRK